MRWKNTERLHDLVDRISKDMEAKEVVNVAKLANKDKGNRINALKAFLAVYLSAMVRGLEERIA